MFSIIKNTGLKDFQLMEIFTEIKAIVSNWVKIQPILNRSHQIIFGSVDTKTVQLLKNTIGAYQVVEEKKNMYLWY